MFISISVDYAIHLNCLKQENLFAVIDSPDRIFTMLSVKRLAAISTT